MRAGLRAFAFLVARRLAGRALFFAARAVLREELFFAVFFFFAMVFRGGERM